MRTPFRAISSLFCLLVLTSGCGSAIENAMDKTGANKPFASRRHPNNETSTEVASGQPTAPMGTPMGAPMNAPMGAPPAGTMTGPITSPMNTPQPGGFNSPMYSGSTLYVVISGNATCSPALLGNIFNRSTELVSTSLFDGFKKSMMDKGFVRQTDNVIFACYERLSPQMQVYDLKNRPEVVPINEAQLDAVVIPQAQYASRVVIIGHSYGGWRAMHLASSQQTLAYVRAPIQLVTVDPISKANCTNPFMPGCRQAPADFGEQELATLHARTQWLNVVQTPGFIASDEIPAAHVNLKLRAASHFTIVTNPTLWQAVTQFVSGQPLQ